jgi:hypothetical protein
MQNNENKIELRKIIGSTSFHENDWMAALSCHSFSTLEDS